jgi:hypothetical protein
MTGRMLRKTCIRLSVSTNTSFTYFLGMPIPELAEFIDDLKEANKK